MTFQAERMHIDSPYTRLVEAKRSRHPCLLTLHAFLSAPGVSPCTGRIVSIDYICGHAEPVPREISPSSLADELEDLSRDEKELGPRKLGQILLVENISKEIVEELGSRLDIDPMFFASHVHSAWREFEAQSPKFCELPSWTKQQQHFATFPYHQSLVFPEIEPTDYKLLCQSNIRRKVIVFPSYQGPRFGLAQHCCSILVVPRRNEGWLGLVLVDSPIRDTYMSLRGKQQVVIQTPSMPLFGGTEDFLPANFPHQDPAPSTGKPMLEQLLYHWTIARPADFNPEKLTLRALSYYPLRLIAAEWVSYLAIMCFTLQHSDSPPTGNTVSPTDLDRVNSALVSISSWPRRVASSTTSLAKSISFINYHGQGDTSDNWKSLQEDYEYLALSLINQGKQLEASVPLVTTYLQLIESRRAYLETKNVSRLTTVALVFVPLSFVSGLFSMNEDFAPGGPLFWLFFVVSFPVLILVFLVATSSNLGFIYSLPCGWFENWAWNIHWRVAGPIKD